MFYQWDLEEEDQDREREGERKGRTPAHCRLPCDLATLASMVSVPWNNGRYWKLLHFRETQTLGTHMCPQREKLSTPYPLCKAMGHWRRDFPPGLPLLHGWPCNKETLCPFQLLSRRLLGDPGSGR